MSKPRKPRRICRQCHTQKCKKAEHVYCSDACYRRSRRKPQPLCPVCRRHPCKRQRRTCSRVCGAKWRGPELRAVCLRNLEKMRQGRRRAFLKRMADRLRAELVAFAQATTHLERFQVALRIYRKGYSNGRSASYYTYAVAARRQAS